MGRPLALAYSAVAYATFLASFLYMVAFLGSFAVPRTVDAGGPASPPAVAVVVDLLLIGMFSLQHTIMARRGFKDRLALFLPRHLERSTFVLVTGLVLLFLFWQWRPLPAVVWDTGGGVAASLGWGLVAVGWVVVLTSSFLIDHFALFGLRQAWEHTTARPARPAQFTTTGLYRYVRHPLMTGFLLAMWATPRMTVGHVLFAVGMTGYLLVGTLFFEERELLRHHGALYREYRRRVPALIPWPGRTADEGAIHAAVDVTASPEP